MASHRLTLLFAIVTIEVTIDNIDSAQINFDEHFYSYHFSILNKISNKYVIAKVTLEHFIIVMFKTNCECEGLVDVENNAR